MGPIMAMATDMDMDMAIAPDLAHAPLKELQVKKFHDSDTALDSNTAPDTAGNAKGSGENCESRSELNLIRGGGCETQDGK